MAHWRDANALEHPHHVRANVIESGCGCGGGGPRKCACKGHAQDAAAPGDDYWLPVDSIWQNLGLGQTAPVDIVIAPIPMTQEGYARLIELVPAIGGLDPALQRMIAGLAAVTSGEAGAPSDVTLGIRYQVPDPNTVGGLSQMAQAILGKSAGAMRWQQLRAANIGMGDAATGREIVGTPDGNITPFYPGQLLYVPDSWANAIAERRAAGITIAGLVSPATPGGGVPGVPGVPPVPGIGGGGAIVDGATVLQAQTFLAAWGRSTQAISPTDYGATATEFSGVAGPRTIEATASFQRWSNTKKATTLRTDGILDRATRDELAATVAGLLVNVPATTAPPGTPGNGSGTKAKSEDGGGLALLALGAAAFALKVI